MDVRYTELVAAPVKTIEAIYAKFGLPGNDDNNNKQHAHVVGRAWVDFYLLAGVAWAGIELN